MTISHNSDFITQNCDFITRKLPYFWTALYMSEEICTDVWMMVPEKKRSQSICLHKPCLLWG